MLNKVVAALNGIKKRWKKTRGKIDVGERDGSTWKGRERKKGKGKERQNECGKIGGEMQRRKNE